MTEEGIGGIGGGISGGGSGGAGEIVTVMAARGGGRREGDGEGARRRTGWGRRVLAGSQGRPDALISLSISHLQSAHNARLLVRVNFEDPTAVSKPLSNLAE